MFHQHERFQNNCNDISLNLFSLVNQSSSNLQKNSYYTTVSGRTHSQTIMLYDDIKTADKVVLNHNMLGFSTQEV